MTSSDLSREQLIAKIEELECELELACAAPKPRDQAIGSVNGQSVSRSRIEAARNQMYDEFFEFLPLPAFETDRDGMIVRVNAKSLVQFGYDLHEVLGKLRFTDVLKEDARARMEAGFAARQKGIKSTGNEYIAETKDGILFEVLIYSDGIFIGGEFQGMRGVVIDMSDRVTMEKERKILEEQLRHARRVESVGRLAAGVAHDFNNLLSPIIGYSEVVIDNLGPDHPLSGDMKEILSSAHSARDITRQLLTFGQKQQVNSEVLDINEIIGETATLARRLVPENIDIVYNLSTQACRINGDSAQIKQILLNLFVNAGDAISQKGKIAVVSKIVELQRDLHNPWECIPKGKYAVIQFQDDGKGMDEELQKRIFEPFFSTKDAAGAGLGLSTVWGIVRMHNGYVLVDSKPGEGAIVSVYIPLGRLTPSTAPSPSRALSMPGALSVLVLDDDERMCRMVRRLLSQQGYTVMLANSANQAREVVANAQEPIDLLLTDVVLPELDGKTLATELRRSRPEMKVLYMTGYSMTSLADYDLDNEPNMLRKPFDVETLIKKVEDVLDGN